MATLTREATIALALAEVGTVESPAGSNLTMYGAWYGFNGQPWCAMFLSWCLHYAGNASGYRFASTASSVAWARRVGRLRPIDQAQPGDVMVRLYTSTTGHTGMATGRPSDGRLRTVEGNTSGSNDRDGGSVMHRDRSLSWWHYCIRLDYPAPPQEDDMTPEQAATLDAIAAEVGKLATIIRDPVDSIMTDTNAIAAEVGRLATVIRDETVGMSRRLDDALAKLDQLLAKP